MSILSVVQQTPKYGKNCETLSLSLSPENEFSLVNATFTNLDAEDKSPGSPIAPIPLL
jgi:hypothetical protein